MSGRFDFITSEDFRSSLEQDYQEMERCAGVEAWKSVQILAGSIVEALLVDYLVARPPKELTKDPLKMTLDEAIKACQTEKALSDRTSGLCGVIRSYRNLIHPGRQIRYDEPPPSKQSASIATALVDMIVEDIVKVRKGAFGFTAEQLLEKIQRNQNALPLLPHLLKETHETEKERLLISVLPDRYLRIGGLLQDESTIDHLKRLQNAFRVLFESVPDKLKRKVSSQFVSYLKNGEGSQADIYADGLFFITDMKYLDPNDHPIVIDYFLSRVPSIHTANTAEKMAGLAPYLTEKHMTNWLDPYVKALVSNMDYTIKTHVEASLMVAQSQLSQDCATAVDKRLNDWLRHFRNKDQPELMSVIEKLKATLESYRNIEL